MSSQKPKVPKEYRELVKAAQRNGWKLSQSPTGHAKLTKQRCHHVVIPSTYKSKILFAKIEGSLKDELVFD